MEHRQNTLIERRKTHGERPREAQKRFSGVHRIRPLSEVHLEGQMKLCNLQEAVRRGTYKWQWTKICRQLGSKSATHRRLVIIDETVHLHRGSLDDLAHA